ncbi:MAG TPA: flagellar basal body rod protein FlgB [Deltaproteobacteria bacterium]|nr:flagellar basal body rod protein FlgB [Deltaproteobacteria bacterium]
MRQQQHALTASNLANAETPGFRAKFVDFERALSDALEPGAAPDAGTSEIRELAPNPWSADGNSVLPEREQARLQENALMYRAVAQGLSKRLALLKFAANDGR